MPANEVTWGPRLCKHGSHSDTRLLTGGTWGRVSAGAAPRTAPRGPRAEELRLAEEQMAARVCFSVPVGGHKNCPRLSLSQAVVERTSRLPSGAVLTFYF